MRFWRSVTVDLKGKDAAGCRATAKSCQTVPYRWEPPETAEESKLVYPLPPRRAISSAFDDVGASEFSAGVNHELD